MRATTLPTGNQKFLTRQGETLIRERNVFQSPSVIHVEGTFEGVLRSGYLFIEYRIIITNVDFGQLDEKHYLGDGFLDLIPYVLVVGSPITRGRRVKAYQGEPVYQIPKVGF